MGAALWVHSLFGQWDTHATLASGCAVDPLLGGSRCFSIGTVNVTSIYTYSTSLLDFPASLIAVQETKMCQGDTGILGPLRANWQVFHPALPVGTGDRRSRSGGVLLLADKAWQVEILQKPPLHAEAHNCLVFSALHRPSSYRLVGAVYYGRPKMRAQSLEDLSHLAAHLHTYDHGNVAILGDFNLDAAGCMPRYLADYLLDAHWFVANQTGQAPEHTCITATTTSRADGMYCTPSVFELVIGCQVWDWGSLPTHRPLIFDLRCQAWMSWWQRPSRSIVADSGRTVKQIRDALSTGARSGLSGQT
eukprot:5678938-Amphidinium_carterae.1